MKTIIHFTTLQGFTARPSIHTSGDREAVLALAISKRNLDTSFITLETKEGSDHFTDDGRPLF